MENSSDTAPVPSRLRVYTNVEFVDARGASAGEFDRIKDDLLIEEKSATGLQKLNPRTGLPAQTPLEWAENQIIRKTVVRLRNLQQAVATQPQSGSHLVPSIEELRKFRRLEFRITGNDPVMQVTVEAQLARLRVEFPDWQFTARFGE